MTKNIDRQAVSAKSSIHQNNLRSGDYEQHNPILESTVQGPHIGRGSIHRESGSYMLETVRAPFPSHQQQHQGQCLDPYSRSTSTVILQRRNEERSPPSAPVRYNNHDYNYDCDYDNDHSYIYNHSHYNGDDSINNYGNNDNRDGKSYRCKYGNIRDEEIGTGMISEAYVVVPSNSIAINCELSHSPNSTAPPLPHNMTGRKT